MSKKDKVKDTVQLIEQSEKLTEPIVDIQQQEQLITFERWFKLKNFKFHWADGMRAYADTSGRRTVSQWNEIFKNY